MTTIITDWYLSGQATCPVTLDRRSSLRLTVPHACQLSLSSLSSYHHPISLFLVYAAVNPPSRPTPCNLSHVNKHSPIRSRVLFHSLQHFLFPLPTTSHLLVLLPLSVTFISTPAHDQKRCTKAISHFFRKQARNVRNASKASPAWIIYVSIPPGGIYLAQAKEGYWCVCWKRKKRALRYKRRNTNLSKN
jgi:hypothetical protein